MKKEISVIIPCYNEAMRISDTVKVVDDYLKQKHFNYEIILVNDGSTDNTLDIILSLSHKYKNLYFFTSQTNRGKGFAVRQGLLMARYYSKLILDADMSVGITELYKLNWIWLRDIKILKGQRIQVKKQPIHRIFAGKCFKILVWLFTGLYMDTQSPFTFLRLPTEFYQDLKIEGFAFDVEILYNAKLQGIKIEKIDVDYYNEEDSSVKLKHYFLMFKELLEIKKRKR